jgi:hypothetical protein
MRGLFPQSEPGDRWKWALVAVLGFAVIGVLRMREVKPIAFLTAGAIGLVVLVLVAGALLRTLR